MIRQIYVWNGDAPKDDEIKKDDDPVNPAPEIPDGLN